MYRSERGADVSSKSTGDADSSLALFGWKDLDTAKFTGILIAATVGWRLVAYASVAVKVGGFR